MSDDDSHFFIDWDLVLPMLVEKVRKELSEKYE